MWIKFKGKMPDFNEDNDGNIVTDWILIRNSQSPNEIDLARMSKPHKPNVELKHECGCFENHYIGFSDALWDEWMYIPK